MLDFLARRRLVMFLLLSAWIEARLESYCGHRRLAIRDEKFYNIHGIDEMGGGKNVDC